jgi:hypothetical protein
VTKIYLGQKLKKKIQLKQNKTTTFLYNPLRGRSDSNRSLWPSKELIKCEISSFFSLFRSIFACLDPDPLAQFKRVQSGSERVDQDSHESALIWLLDPDPQHCPEYCKKWKGRLIRAKYFWDSKARTRAKALVARLKDELHRQQFAIAIQACVGGKILGTYITKLFFNFFLFPFFVGWNDGDHRKE